MRNSNKSQIQRVLTNMGQSNPSASYNAPGYEKGISLSVVHALSLWITVEVKREGKVYRQSFRNGIPQTDVLAVGVTQETGTSITFMPNPELFSASRFDPTDVKSYMEATAAAYPDLKVTLHEKRTIQRDHSTLIVLRSPNYSSSSKDGSSCSVSSYHCSPRYVKPAFSNTWYEPLLCRSHEA